MREGEALRRITTGAAVVFVVAAALAGCRAEEQDRPLEYRKGVYGGAEDEAVTQDARDSLKRRIRRSSALGL